MKKINLLIIDDRIENIISLEALLKDIENLHIITSTDPNEALQICWKQHIDLALVDVQMPIINGFEFVTYLKQNPKTSPIVCIMVTAISKEDEYLVKGLKSGAVDYLHKPLNPDATIAKVKSYMTLIEAQLAIKEKNIELEISQQRLIAAKEEADQARKFKESFLANMSHELRTPINGIIGIAHILKNSDLTAEQINWVKKLDVATTSLLHIINDILDLSKIESGKMKFNFESISLPRLIDEVSQLFVDKCHSKNIDYKVSIDSSVHQNIKADPIRLKQVLINYLSNSFKFTKEGHIHLRVESLKENKDEIYLKFSVEDSGIGIKEADLLKIFEEFEQGEVSITKKYGGTGLGLSIVKKIAQLSNAKISAHSELGIGSTFCYERWFDKSPIENQNKQPEQLYSTLEKFHHLKVLIAEDNELNSFILSKILMQWNCQTKVVVNGQEAINEVNLHQYDLIFMDVHMPVISGFDAIRTIRANENTAISTLPIISISASVLPEEIQEALNAGANVAIGKPFDPVELHQTISRLMSN